MAWDVNEIVIDECFNDLFDISVGNDFNEDAWKGTIIVTENGEEVPLTCYIGCGGNAFNKEIVLDGNDDSTDQASTYCLNKQMCHLKLSKKEGKRTYNGPDRISLILHFVPGVIVSDLKILLFYIGTSTSAPSRTTQSSKPESINQGMTVMKVT